MDWIARGVVRQVEFSLVVGRTLATLTGSAVVYSATPTPVAIIVYSTFPAAEWKWNREWSCAVQIACRACESGGGARPRGVVVVVAQPSTQILKTRLGRVRRLGTIRYHQ